MDADNLIVLTTILIIVLGIIGCGMFFGIMSPIRDNNAQIECEQDGFETHVKYNNYMFQTEPVALVCGTLEERMIKDGDITAYSTDGDGNVIVQELK